MPARDSLRDTTGDVREGKFSDVSGRSDMLHVMAQELQPVSRALTTTVAGEIVDPAGLAARAAEVAARQRSPETRRTYAAVYRTFCAFLGDGLAAEQECGSSVSGSARGAWCVLLVGGEGVAAGGQVAWRLVGVDVVAAVEVDVRVDRRR